MDEQNVGTQTPVENNGNQVPPNAAPVTNPPVVTTVTAEQQKEPSFFKRNWKKIALGATTVLTAVGSAIVAYKKGKASGMNMVPMPGTDDGISPLDPNVE